MSDEVKRDFVPPIGPRNPLGDIASMFCTRCATLEAENARLRRDHDAQFNRAQDEAALVDRWIEATGCPDPTTARGAILQLRRELERVRNYLPKEHVLHCNANHEGPIGGDMCICVRYWIDKLAAYDKWKGEIEDSGDKDGWAVLHEAKATIEKQQRDVNSLISQRDELRRELEDRTEERDAAVNEIKSADELERRLLDMGRELEAAKVMKTWLDEIAREFHGWPHDERHGYAPNMLAVGISGKLRELSTANQTITELRQLLEEAKSALSSRSCSDGNDVIAKITAALAAPRKEQA